MSYLNLNLDREFAGKRIIVTGSSRGLGAVVCETLAERNAKIAMFSRSKKVSRKMFWNFYFCDLYEKAKINRKSLIFGFSKKVKKIPDLDIFLAQMQVL